MTPRIPASFASPIRSPRRTSSCALSSTRHCSSRSPRTPGRAGRLVDPSGHDYGSFGEVDPRIARAWGLPGRPVVAVINLPQLFALIPDGFRASAVPSAQPIDRDLAVLVDDATPVGEVLRL